MASRAHFELAFKPLTDLYLPTLGPLFYVRGFSYRPKNLADWISLLPEHPEALSWKESLYDMYHAMAILEKYGKVYKAEIETSGSFWARLTRLQHCKDTWHMILHALRTFCEEHSYAPVSKSASAGNEQILKDVAELFVGDGKKAKDRQAVLLLMNHATITTWLFLRSFNVAYMAMSKDVQRPFSSFREMIAQSRYATAIGASHPENEFVSFEQKR